MIQAFLNQAVKAVFDICLVVAIWYGIAYVLLGNKLYEIVRGVMI